MFDYLIVGAGFAGSVLAERLAAGSNKKVLICDKRPHIGGNAYDHYNEAGILIHKYGPHIFHTNSREVFEYLSRFTESIWIPLILFTDSISRRLKWKSFLGKLLNPLNRYAHRKTWWSAESDASCMRSFSATIRANNGDSILQSSTQA